MEEAAGSPEFSNSQRAFLGSVPARLPACRSKKKVGGALCTIGVPDCTKTHPDLESARAACGWTPHPQAALLRPSTGESYVSVACGAGAELDFTLSNHAESRQLRTRILILYGTCFDAGQAWEDGGCGRRMGLGHLPVRAVPLAYPSGSPTEFAGEGVEGVEKQREAG